MLNNILVCDDDTAIVDSIEIYLQQEGYHVIKAYDGVQALEVLRKEEIQLVIIDVMMPRLDGIRAILKIREESNMPIIVLSAKTADSDKILGLNVGADDYVSKPLIRWNWWQGSIPRCAVIQSWAMRQSPAKYFRAADWRSMTI